MEEKLIMTGKEIDRLKVITDVISERLSWREAGDILGLSERQIGRICARVREEGNKGVIHGLRGRESNRSLPEGLKDEALAAVRSRYSDFGPTFACEKLAAQGIKLSVASLRQAMIKAGIWRPRVKGMKRRAWRERRSCAGMMVQIDGSDHDWFEGRGERCVFVGFIDDATSRLMYGEFVKSEDTLTLMRLTKEYVERYGRPVEAYVDKDSIYRINRQASVEEELRDVRPQTQYARAMEELGIKVIWAHSPQAKGRIERLFKTLQDRLVKELRLAGISDREEANRFLWGSYIAEHNARYARPPANETDAHRPLLKGHRLDDIFSLRSKRTVANDWTIRFQNRLFQLDKEQPARVRPRDQVSVEIRLDGSINLGFRGRYLNFRTIEPRQGGNVPAIKPLPREKAACKPGPACRKPCIPPPDHPWRRERIGRAVTA